MQSLETFYTQRLIGVGFARRRHRLRAEHLDLLCIMHQDSTVMATLAGVRSDKQTQKFLKENLNHWDWGRTSKL